MTGDPLQFPSAYQPPRVEWSEFFRRHAQPHGLRLFMPHLESASPEVRRLEESLLSLLKRHRSPGPYALRRSLDHGAPRVEGSFADEIAANELAALIGAVPGPAPVGYRTFRRLAADAAACERIGRLAADSRRSWLWGRAGGEGVHAAASDALEKIVRAIVGDVHAFTEGRPHLWVPIELVTRRLVLLDDPEPAVQIAVTRGWLVREGRHSICLTEAGCRAADPAGSASAS